MAATVAMLGSAPAIPACAQRPPACNSHARINVDRSSPARPGTMRRAGMTIQFVVTSRNSPIGLRNGTRSHWKWKRASSRNTRNETIVSTRKMAIWANISVLCELVAHLGAAARGRRQGLGEALAEFFFIENAQRRFGRTALGGDVLAQLGGRLQAIHRKLGRAEDAVLGELQRLLARDSRALR